MNSRNDDPLPEPPLWAKLGLVMAFVIMIALLIRDGCSPLAQADTVLALEAEKPNRRAALAAFIERQDKYGKAPDPDFCANQLLFCETVGGAKAELVAAVAAVESSWNPHAINPRSGARGLMQLLPSTSRSVYGKLPSSWGENLYQGSTYLAGCIAAERAAGNECVRYGLCRYRAGPKWRDPLWGGVPLAYAKKVLNLRGEMP